MLNQIVRNLQIIEKIICVIGHDSVREQWDRNCGNRRQSNGNQDQIEPSPMLCGLILQRNYPFSSDVEFS
jgi:hypothetical protein